MSKLVYLFELDSVRHSQQEIEKGQKVLFEELVRNGNRVVLSFNQLSDSHAFLAAVQNKKSYDKILELFQAGALQVSLFGKTRTPSQYMQASIEKYLTEKEGSFWFSGIPVERTNTFLLTELKFALQYSDPERLMDLRYEVSNSETPDEESCERLEYLYRFVKMILLISKERKANNPAKTGKMKSLMYFYGKIKAYQDKITDMPNEQPLIRSVSNWKEIFRNAMQQLEAIEHVLRETAKKTAKDEGDILKYLNNRSNWYKEILYESETCTADAASSSKRQYLALAEAVIDLCYNYTIEDSISGVAKHYDENDDFDFLRDFCQRMELYWTDYCNQNHIFYEKDRTDCIKYYGELPDWNLAASLWRNNMDTENRIYAIRKWMARRISIFKKASSDFPTHTPRPEDRLYELNMKKERSRWKRLTCISLLFQTSAAVVLVILFLILNIGMGYVEEYFGVSGMTLHVFGSGFADAILLAVIETAAISLLTSIVSGIFRVPDILDSCKRVLQCIGNLVRFFQVPAGLSYVHKTRKDEKNERISQQS